MRSAFAAREAEIEGEGTAHASARYMSEDEARALLDEFLMMVDIVLAQDEFKGRGTA
jgi:hypothetical protein